MISDIVRPKTVAEAVRAKSAPGAAWLGGGTWLNSGKAENITTLVSLENLGLDSIRSEKGRCMIGAAVTFQALVDNTLAPRVLRDAARLTASRTLRNMVTVGGELGFRAPDSALIPVLLALDAEVQLAGKKKPLPIQDFIDEVSAGLILGISVPDQFPAALAAVSRTSHSPRSLVVAVSARAAAPTLPAPRIVVSDCRGQLARLSTEGRLLDGAEFSPRPDMHASVEYKRYMTGVLVADLLAALVREAGG